MKKHITAIVMLAASTVASQPAWALGFGRVVSDAVLGQSLQMSAPVHLDAGEHFGVECVSAQVYFGESRLLPSEVRIAADRGASDNDWVVKISTVRPVSEPIVEIDVAAGCERRFERRFTAFADPPSSRPVASTVDTVASAAVASASPVLLPSVQAARANAAGVATAPAPALPAPRKGPTLALARELSSRAHPAHPAGASRATTRGGKHAAPAADEGPMRLVLDTGFAHLKLDVDDPVESSTPSAGAASAVEALADLGDPAARQLRELEQSIQAMKRDNQANHDRAAQLAAQLEQAQSRSDWLPYVLGLLAIAVAAIVALALKLRAQSRLAHDVWFAESRAAAAAAPAPTPVLPTGALAASASAPASTSAPVAPSEPAPASAEMAASDLHPAATEAHEDASGAVVADMAATQPFGPVGLPGSMGQFDAQAPREVSVEELLDLEQQADFFIALGQEDAAVDLLMAHLRSAGGQSPLPYTKLLEIYRRQGDRSAYERMRARFNRRFNAYAPDWETGPSAGRLLEDYPQAIAQIEAAWRSPIDSMALLEALLFKRDDSSELFELAAYRDILLLYSIARDLWQLGGGSPGAEVDVLLPLDDGADFDPNDPSQAGVLAQPMEHAGGALLEPAGLETLPEIDLSAPPPDEHVHATLDELSLAPVEPVPAKAPIGPAASHDH